MKKENKFLIIYIFYIMLLFACYKSYLTIYYYNYGFFDHMTFLSLVVSIFLLIVSYKFLKTFIPKSYKEMILYVLFLINYIPTIVIYSYIPSNLWFLFLVSLYWFSIFHFNSILKKYSFKNLISSFSKNKFIYSFLISLNKFKNKIIKKIRDFSININNKIIINNKSNFIIDRLSILVLIEFLTTSIILIKYTGLSFNFSSVYDLRTNFSNSNVPLLLIYLFSSFKVINPVIFCCYFKKNDNFMYIFTFLLQILFFLADGSKSTLFALFLTIFLVIFFEKNKIDEFINNKNTKVYILLLFMVANIFAFVELDLFKSTFIYNYFIRRLFFIPSLLHSYYFDFFSNHSILLFSQSFLSKFGVVSQYSKPIQNIIGEIYFSNPDMICNNGLFSDAIMNLGSIGVIIFPLFINIALSFLDYCSKGIKQSYLTALIISISYILMSSSFFTVMLTHGFILLCILLLFFIPKTKERE